MKVIDDGVIKYDRSDFKAIHDIKDWEFLELEKWRRKLYQLNLIGEYPVEKIGFGNISKVSNYLHIYQCNLPQFIITGTQTGKYPNLNENHYTRVLDYDISRLKVKMQGPIEASSEVLTHAAIYSASTEIKAIFHIHSNKIWKKMCTDGSDFTGQEIPYGTVEMALATQECVGKKTKGAFCMKGHDDGVVIYGKDLEEVGQLTLELYQKYHSR